MHVVRRPSKKGIKRRGESEGKLKRNVAFGSSRLIDSLAKVLKSGWRYYTILGKQIQGFIAFLEVTGFLKRLKKGEGIGKTYTNKEPGKGLEENRGAYFRDGMSESTSHGRQRRHLSLYINKDPLCGNGRGLRTHQSYDLGFAGPGHKTTA